MNSLELVTSPSGEPLTLSEAKGQVYLKESDNTKDGELNDYIAAARDYLENHEHGNIQIMPATYRLHLDAFPTDGDWITLPKPPLRSVTSISYLDSTGETQTMDASDYVVDAATFPGRIGLAYGKVWPATREQIKAIAITFVAGFNEVPPGIKTAARLLVGHYFENREATSERPPSNIAIGVEEHLGTVGVIA